MTHVATTSPFSCRWIVRGSEMRVSNWSLAVCVRMRVHPRIVTEEECATCALWEGPVDESDPGPAPGRFLDPM